MLVVETNVLSFSDDAWQCKQVSANPSLGTLKGGLKLSLGFGIGGSLVHSPPQNHPSFEAFESLIITVQDEGFSGLSCHLAAGPGLYISFTIIAPSGMALMRPLTSQFMIPGE